MQYPTSSYCGKAADTAHSADTPRKSIAAKLCDDLKRSLRRPSSRTLRLLERALKLLTPFESPRASVASNSEKQDLLELINVHRIVLCPYIDVDRIESNLRWQ